METQTPLAVVVQQVQLEPEAGQHLLASFKPMFASAQELVEQAAQIFVTDATQVTEIKASRAMRLKLRAVRLEVETTRKKLKEDSLKVGKAIEAVAKKERAAREEAEEKLQAEREAAMKREEEADAKLRQQEAEQLRMAATMNREVNAEIVGELLEIMAVYHQQEDRGSIDTPGGLEHMGDVWDLFSKWESMALEGSEAAK